MANKKKHSGYTNLINKLEEKELYIEKGGNLSILGDKRTKIVREVLNARKILLKAEDEGIYIEDNKIIFLDGSKKYRIFGKEDTSEEILPTPKKQIKIVSSSSEDEVPKRASTPVKKTPRKVEASTPKKKGKSSSEEPVKKKEKVEASIAKKVVKKKEKSSSEEPVKKKEKVEASIAKKVVKKKEKSNSEESVKKKETHEIKELVKNTTKFPILTTATRRSNFFDYFYDLYESKYAPPKDLARRLYVDDETYNKYAPLVKVFAPEKSDNNIIIRLITEREPVNIGMKRYYSLDGLKEKYGYVTSYYQRYYEATRELAPNIGVYLKAPVIQGDKITNIHLYNAIGYALDSKDQPDYMYLKDKNIKEYLLGAYKCLLERALHCASYHKVGRVIIPVIGGGAFSSLYPGGGEAFREEVFLPAFKLAIKNYYKTMEIDFMGDKNDTVIKTLSKTGHKYVGYFPDFIYSKDFNPANTLLVNAWDCHTVLGNGNKGDNSIDGYIGRTSAIQFFGLGLANPHIKNNIVKFGC